MAFAAVTITNVNIPKMNSCNLVIASNASTTA